MKCANCGEPIVPCELGELAEEPPCYYHPGNGFHRCDGLPEDHVAPVATVPAEMIP